MVEILQQNMFFLIVFHPIIILRNFDEDTFTQKISTRLHSFFNLFLPNKMFIKKAFILFMNKQRYDVFELFGV